AIFPVALQVLVRRRLQDAAAVAAGPALDLIGPAAFVAATFPARRPACVGRRRPTALAVPEQDLAGAVGLHPPLHRRERGRAEFRRAERLAVAGADAFEEVGPQGLGLRGVQIIPTLQRRRNKPPGLPAELPRRPGAAGDLLLNDLHAALGNRSAILLPG